MNKSSSRLTLAIALATCISLFCTGCTSTRFHSPSAKTNLAIEVRVGDRVVCHLNDGAKKAFSVTAMEPDALVGPAERVPVADVTSIEVTRFDGKKTIVQAGKVVGTVVLCTVALAGLGAMGLALR
jgi:hypothetical protein